MSWLALWRWLISPVGRQCILLLSLMGAGWWLYDTVYDRGYADAEGEHAAAVAAAATAQREYERKRDLVAAEIADTTREQARAASQEIQAETNAGQERIRTVMQRVEVPANCPQGPPAPVIEELNTMIDRANKANR
jgi:hypothetical protein